MAKKHKDINSIKDLIHDPNNANKGSDRGKKAVADSLEKYGAGRSIVVDKNGVIIGGNKTLEAAQAAGIEIEVIKTGGDKLVVVQREDLDLLEDDKARKLAYADNRAGELGLNWHLDQIKSDLDSGMILDDLFSLDELDDMGVDLPSVEPEEAPEAQMDAAEELQAKWKVQSGDVWEIGEHRLMCGDSTSTNDIDTLRQNKNADACFTSPPYFNQRPEYSLFQDYDSYNSFLDYIILGIKFISKSNGFILGWNTGDNQPDCLPMIADQTVRIHDSGKTFTYLDTIIWVKHGAVYSIPRSAHIKTHNYFYPALKWEPIIIFRRGDMPKFNKSDEKDVSSFGNNVWEISQVNGNVQKLTGHPAMFPDELVSRLIKCYTQSGAVLYEPFCGSGTTMVAAERLGRVCYGMEIEPKYCAVILERMQQMGLEPELVENGTTSA